MRRCGLLIVVIVLAIASVGCAGVRGPDEKALIMELIENWKAAAEEGDIDGLMVLYSRDFVGEQGETYDSLEKQLAHLLPMLEAYGVSYDTADVALQIHNGEAVAGPLLMRAMGRTTPMDFTLAKENGAWLITATESTL